MMVTALPWINWVLQTRLVKRILPSEKDLIGFGKLLWWAFSSCWEKFGSHRLG